MREPGLSGFLYAGEATGEGKGGKGSFGACLGAAGEIEVGERGWGFGLVRSDGFVKGDGEGRY